MMQECACTVVFWGVSISNRQIQNNYNFLFVEPSSRAVSFLMISHCGASECAIQSLLLVVWSNVCCKWCGVQRRCAYIALRDNDPFSCLSERKEHPSAV